VLIELGLRTKKRQRETGNRDSGNSASTLFCPQGLVEQAGEVFSETKGGVKAEGS